MKRKKEIEYKRRNGSIQPDANMNGVVNEPAKLTDRRKTLLLFSLTATNGGCQQDITVDSRQRT